jgi:hypothetical protein
VGVYENREGIYQAHQEEMEQLTAKRAVERKASAAVEGDSTAHNDTGWWPVRKTQSCSAPRLGASLAAPRPDAAGSDT